MFYVYLIQSINFDWKYIGYSSDLRKRFEEHQKGLSSATKPYRQFELIFYEAYKSKSDAKRRELYFKTNQGKRAIKLMLRDSLAKRPSGGTT